MSFLTDAARAALSSGSIQIETLFEAQFKSGTLYAWSGATELAHAGAVWTASGAAISHSVGDIAASAFASPFTVKFTGLPVGMWDMYAKLMLTDPTEYRGRRIVIYMQIMDLAGAPIAPPIAYRAGIMDVPEFAASETEQSITMHCESAMVTKRRPRWGNYTDADQQRRYPGDLGFEYAPIAASKNIKHPVVAG